MTTHAAVSLPLTLMIALGVTVALADDLAPPRALATVVPGKPENIGAYPGHEHHPTKKWIATLASAPTSYTLQHWACYDESHAPEAIALEGQIGMMSPGGGNWYSNGFFNFAIGDDEGRNFAVRTIRALDSGERASCEFVWELPEAWVRVRFMALPDVQPLLCSIIQLPKGEDAPVMRVRLVCYPGGYFKNGRRVGHTPLREMDVGTKADLDPAAEWTMALYDRVYDLNVSGSSGGCGAIALPEYVGAASVEIGSYACKWTLETPPGGSELRFAFWDGLRLPNAELVPYLEGQFEAAAPILRDLDFTPLRYDPGVVAGIAEQFNRLLAETKGADEERQAFQETSAQILQLRERMAAQVTDLAAEDEYIAALDRLEELLWQLRMKWVFSD